MHFLICETMVTEHVIVKIYSTFTVKKPFPVGFEEWILLKVNFWITFYSIMNKSLMWWWNVNCYLITKQYMLLMVEQLLTDMLFYILKKCVLLKSIKEIYRQYTHVVSKYTIYVYELQKQEEKRVSGEVSGLFRTGWKFNLYLPTMYVCCVYPAMLKIIKQLPDCLQIEETSAVLIIFNGVLCRIHVYTVAVFYRCSTWIRYQKSYILVSNRIYQIISC